MIIALNQNHHMSDNRHNQQHLLEKKEFVYCVFKNISHMPQHVQKYKRNSNFQQ